MLQFLQNTIYMGTAAPESGGGSGGAFIDQTYDALSTNAQSGTAVAEGLLTVANKDLSNLSSDGQMIVESVNGTISNCVLEIPQNIKCSIASNVVTLANGSILTNTGSTYATTTLSSDQTYTIDNSSADGNYLLCSNGAAIQAPIALEIIGSGASLPADGSTYTYFFNTTDKLIYKYDDGAWSATSYCYPFAEITVSSGVASFAKDSNGNNMIFNGACFVGHHAVIYPNISVLEPDGFNANGSLKSINYVKNNLSIIECKANNKNIYISSLATAALRGYEEYEYISDITNPTDYFLYYISSENRIYGYGSGIYSIYNRTNIITLTSTGTSITDFTIRQPVRTATVEMLDNTSVTATGSTTARTLPNRFADVINVKDFGAVGDGVTDDTAAIQAAIAAAGDNQIVFFPGGEEFFVTTILVNKEVTLRGGRIKSNGTAIDINTSGLSGQKGTLIEGMEINAGQIGIKLSYAGGVSIINCEILNAQQYGIWTNSYNELYVNNVRITCSDGTATGRGIFVGASDSVFTNILVYGYGVCIEDKGSNRFTNVHGWIDTTKFTTDEVARTAFIKTNGYSQLTQCVADSYARSIWITGQYARPIINEFTVLHGSDTVWSSVVPEIYHLNNADDVAEEGSGSVITYTHTFINANYLIDRNIGGITQKFINYTGDVCIVDFYNTNVLYSSTQNAPAKSDFIRGDITGGSYHSLNFLEKTTDKIAGYVRVGEDSGTNRAYIQIGTTVLNSYGQTYITLREGYFKTLASFIPISDNTNNLGIATNRWKEVFAANGTINTSDERQKQDIAPIDERVFRAWGNVEFKQFLFNDAVEKKGKENARIHFGLIAQQVKEAFESEGLDGFKYGLLCYDEWEDEFEENIITDKPAEYDEDGNEIAPAVTHTERKQTQSSGNAYGIRYSEALALECAYQRWMLEQLREGII